MGEEFDVAIVGARVGGAILAALLGDSGLRVVLVDAATFPSDTISTHFFRGAGLGSMLERIGVLDEVLALGPPRLTCEYNFRGDDPDPDIGKPQDPGSVGYSLSVRRISLDRVLVQRARRTPGVEVLEGAPVRKLLRDGSGRVTGLTVETGGRQKDLTARLVVGADGRNSFVARQAEAGVERDEPATRAMYFRYLEGYEGVRGRHDGPDFSLQGDQLVYAFPSDDDITCLAISINLADFGRFRADPEAAFVTTIGAHPGIADRFRAARPVSRLLGSGPKAAVVRQPWGPGWLLVGDASMHMDPWTGLGMDSAATQAEFASKAIVEWLSGRAAEMTAFGTYKVQRDEALLPWFDYTVGMGRDLSSV